MSQTIECQTTEEMLETSQHFSQIIFTTLFAKRFYNQIKG